MGVKCIEVNENKSVGAEPDAVPKFSALGVKNAILDILAGVI